MTPVRTRSHPGARRAETALRVVLPASAELQTLAEYGSTVDVKVAGRRLRVAWAGEGWRRDIDALTDTNTKLDVVAARRMSPGARAALDHAGIGWVDELGNAEIVIGSILISRTGHNETPSPPGPRWTPAVAAVTEALLLDTPATVAATQAATGLSVGSCTNALRTLTELGYLHADVARGRGSARRIHDPDTLLAAYAGTARALAPVERVTVGVTWRDTLAGIRDIGRRWDDVGINWATTGNAAAALIAPLLTTVTTAVIYIDATTIPALHETATRIGLKPITGGRLTLRPFPTISVARVAETVEGVRLAPWPRVYVDLRETGVHGEEAADHLPEVCRAR